MQSQSSEQPVIFSLTQELTSIYTLFGLIDMRLKKMKKKAIFFVGLARSGKSTVFNYSNDVPLIGVAPGAAEDD
jgi:hypothetical protein